VETYALNTNETETKNISITIKKQMNVMNIKHYLSAAASIMVLAACSEYDPGFSGEAVDVTEGEIKQMQEYTDNFVKQYGEMDPNHTWGFGELADMEEMGTRAVQVDRNNWIVAVKETENYQVVVTEVKTTVGTSFLDQSANPPQYNYEYESKEGYIVPGFPSAVDGMFYVDTNGQGTDVQAHDEAWVKDQLRYNQLQPGGDVTDEEIEYVSWWFRTHPDIESETPPFTEFFIQDISRDYDRVTYPDGDWIDVTGNDPTNAQRQVPVHYVKGTEIDRWENPSGVTYGMDYFAVETKESDGSDFWEHTNNYNKQKGNFIGRNAPATATDTTALTTSTTHYPNRTLKYWTSEGVSQYMGGESVYKNGEGYTTSFSYHNSDDEKTYENYQLVHLKFQGPRTGQWYDGWYIGFDYELHKEEPVNYGADGIKYQTVEPDGYYSNWILKLAPGNPEFNNGPEERVRTLKRRVMCEDLGTTDDFDFNDLVFDVEYTREEEKVDGEWVPKNSDGKWTATITLQASGGTLPIFIQNFDGTEYNVHEYMGGTTAGRLYNPINVGIGVIRPAKALPTCQVTSTNPDDIKILVYSPDAEHRYANKNLELPSVKGAQKFGDNLAPQKICVPVDVRWLREFQQIERAYPHFKEWVESENGAAGFGNEHDWTREGIQEGYLY
jgi:hypothetical protein